MIALLRHRWLRLDLEAKLNQRKLYRFQGWVRPYCGRGE